MQWQKKASRTLLDWAQEGIRTTHNRIVLCGLLVGLCYLPVWLSGLISRASQGSSGLPLIAAVVFLGLQQLWNQRQQLAKMKAPDEDRLLGHVLILCSVVLFPFCRFAIWSQALLWLLALIGIAFSSWGMRFFGKYSLPCLLLLLSVYPKPGVTARILWDGISPPRFLEQIMATAGAAALRVIGQPATAEGIAVKFPSGAVAVNWGCNGFNMAFTMAAAGLILGLFYKQSWLRIVGIIALGVILALIFNIPRIMLLAIAAVYWGDQAFKFWHGSIGGQLFAGVLFTIYYYAVMAIINRKPKKLSA